VETLLGKHRQRLVLPGELTARKFGVSLVVFFELPRHWSAWESLLSGQNFVPRRLVAILPSRLPAAWTNSTDLSPLLGE